MRVVVHGEEQFDQLGRRFEEAADGGLVDAVVEGLEEVARSLPSRVRESAARLPTRGGLAGIVGRSPVTVAVSRGGDPGLTVTVTSDDVDLEQLDTGRVVHPVYGNRRAWVSQAVQSRVISGPLEDAAPLFAGAVADGLAELARHIERA